MRTYLERRMVSSLDEGSPSVLDASSVTPDPDLFVRRATGLVRAVPQRAAWIFNFIPAHPANVLAAGVFFSFALFPGGNFLLALLFDIPLVLAFAYSYGLLSTMIPRTGEDYVFVTRVISPPVGVISSVCWTVSLFLSNAFFAISFIKVGVAPGLSVIGLVAKSHTLLTWGQTLATARGWQLLVGTGMFLLAALIMVSGWRFTLRWQSILFAITVFGIVLCGLIALFTSRSAFIHNFNAFAAPYTHQADTYHATIRAAQKGGVNVHPGLSISNTIPLIGILAIATIYPFISSAYSGELRQARSIRTAHVMGSAGVAAVIALGIFAAIFLHTFGTAFVIAANSSTGLPTAIAASPTYFFLLSASVGATLIAAILVFTYAIYWPLNTYCNFMQQSRIFFAWAFDGLLPKSITKLSRSASPIISLAVTVLISIGVLVWALYSSTFIQVIVYATLLALIAMMLVGLSAVVVPWRRPEFYRAGATQRRFLGVPVVSIAGAGSILAGLFIWVLYLHYSEFGITSKVNMLEWVLGTVVAAIVFYFTVRQIRRRHGVKLELVYGEIPPE
jgi:basic amino acid/polyamine antiporter, APA family